MCKNNWLFSVLVIGLLGCTSEQNIVCPRCNQETSTENWQCQHCGYFFPVEEKHSFFSTKQIVDEVILEEDREHYRMNKLNE